MIWLIFAIVAYLMMAFNIVLDKVLLGKTAVSNPVAYGFYMGLLSIFGLLFLPFGTVSLELFDIVSGMIVGAFFLYALIALYTALHRGDASIVAPFTGGLIPIFVSLMAYFFLGEHLSINQFFAFIILVLGGVMISYSIPKKQIKKGKNNNIWLISIIAALLFAIFYVSIKYIFENQSFISGFIWTRMGSFLATFLLLIPKKNREIIFSNGKSLKPKTGALILFNKSLAGVSFAILNYAISLGSVTLINAMQGVQYVFILILVLFLSKKYPLVLEEKYDRKIIAIKIFAIILIAVGLGILGKQY